MSIKLIVPVALTGGLLFLSACSATTGASSMASATPQEKAVSMKLQPNQAGDSSLTCEQLTAEVASIDGILMEANAASGTSAANNVTNQAVGTAVRHGIARSGAARSVVSKVPFGGSLLNSALNSRAKADERKRQDAVNRAQNAYVRRSTLMGIRTGKGC